MGATARSERIERVERGLQPEAPRPGRPAATATLAERMAFHGVPGVGIAVMDGGEIASAWGYGVRDAESGGEVTPETLFQAASISKPVTSAAVLRLVQDGRLELDRDVND
jgi:CubicO group peptidase (beta-lactamase class C family)